MTHFMFLKITEVSISKIYKNLSSVGLRILTGNDVIIYYRSAANHVNIVDIEAICRSFLMITESILKRLTVSERAIHMLFSCAASY